MSASVLTLTSKERRALIRLLGKFQSRLEEGIRTAEPQAAPGSTGYFAGEAELLALDRKDWRAAEGWVKRLEAGR